MLPYWIAHYEYRHVGRSKRLMLVILGFSVCRHG